MRYYIIAGEASGDLHGGNLISALKNRDDKAEFRFWGGDRMAEAAGDAGTLVRHYRDTAVMGFADVIAKAPKIFSNIRFCRNDILEWHPDLVILIDYPGFNMRIASFCRSRNIRVFYYIAPKTWASREWRNRSLKANIDRLFVIFPFEVEYFRKKGIPFVYRGNPLVDAVDNHAYSPVTDGDYIAVLAGSRKGEISRMMPVCMEVADRMSAMPEFASYKFIVAGAPSSSPEDYAPYIGSRGNVQLVFDRTYDVLKYAKAAVINSGTASLEAALIGTPQLVGWQTTPLGAFIGRKVLRILDRIKFISLANLCLGKLIFKELLQEQFNADNVSAELRRLVLDGGYRARMISDYGSVRTLLGSSGASDAIARAMIGELSEIS